MRSIDKQLLPRKSSDPSSLFDLRAVIEANMKLVDTLLFTFVTLVYIVNALDDPKQCDPAVVRRILSRKSCPNCILKQLHDLSPFTYILNPNGTVPSWVKCASGVIDNLSKDGKSAQAHVYVKNKNTSVADIVNNYYQMEMGSCGRLLETDWATGKKYVISIVSVCPCFCYYRCTTYKTDGAQFSACAIPIGKQSDEATLKCVQKCKEVLAEVGLTVKLQEMTPCTEF